MVVADDYAPYAGNADVTEASFSIDFPAITGGLAPLSFEIIAGALPEPFVTLPLFESDGVTLREPSATYEVSLDADTGEITGVTGFPGLFTGTVQVTDALGQTATADFELDLELAFTYLDNTFTAPQTVFGYPAATAPYLVIPGERVRISGLDTLQLPDDGSMALFFDMTYVSSVGSIVPTPEQQEEGLVFDIRGVQGAVTIQQAVDEITSWVWTVDVEHLPSGKTADLEVTFEQEPLP
jgi:hypothetical protein